MEQTDRNFALVEAAYQQWILRSMNIMPMIEHAGKCANHPDRAAKERCRFCHSLMCATECTKCHEAACQNAALVPECNRARFSIEAFSERLTTQFPVSLAAPFLSPDTIQMACNAVPRILGSL